MDVMNEKSSVKYPIAIKSWRKKPANPSTDFKYPTVIRRVDYTTIAIAAVHRQFRKWTKPTGVFSNENGLFKRLDMGIQNTDWSSKYPDAPETYLPPCRIRAHCHDFCSIPKSTD